MNYDISQTHNQFLSPAEQRMERLLCVRVCGVGYSFARSITSLVKASELKLGR